MPAAWSARAAADGHTLGIISVNHAINPAFYPLPYDMVKDFKGVISLTNSSILIVADPGLQANSVADLVKLARAQPGTINYGSTGNGALVHLVIELFMQQAGIKMTHIPYKTSGQLVTDLLAGRVSIAAGAGATYLPLITAGKLKPLLAANSGRSRYFPDVPSGAEVGLPGFVVNSWLAISAPAQTPDAVVQKLYTDILAITKKQAFLAQMPANGYEINILNGEQTTKRLADDIALWSKLAKDTGIKLSEGN